jgi:hypothetical protein
MENRAENMRQPKKPYSSPSLNPCSLSRFTAGAGQGNGKDAPPIENGLRGPGAPPPPLLIEGFEGEVGEVVQVLSSMGWRSQLNSEPLAEGLNARAEQGEWLVNGGISILLVDIRRRSSLSLRPLTRIEIGASPSALFTVILTDSGQDFTAGGGVRRSDRWHFHGAIAPDALGILIKSIFQFWTAPGETPAKASSTLMLNRSTASAVA